MINSPTSGNILRVAVSDEDAIARLPRPRPDPADVERERQGVGFHGFKPDYTLKAALDAMIERRYTDARALAAGHPNPLASALVDWFVAREPESGLAAEQVIALMETHRGWPEPERLRLRAQQAFHAVGPNDEAVLAFYSATEPTTIGGKLALAGALKAAGRRQESVAIVRTLWREEKLAPNQAGAVLARFGGYLTRDDHVYRFRRLVLQSRTAEAVAQTKFAGIGYDALARAVTAVIDRRSDAERLLNATAARFSTDPLYIFGKSRLLRRADRPVEAARLIVRTEPDAKLAGDGDVWWDERRDLSRMLLDRGEAELAYKIVAASQATGEADQVEAAFHAGWYALRFLGDAKLAEPHFRDLLALATLPRTASRAAYWLGRTREAEGDAEAARVAFIEAAKFGSTFYGQLAREKLGMVTTGTERAPAPSALDRLRFADRDSVKAIRLLAAAGHGELALPFFRGIAETVDAPGEIALLTGLARRLDQSRAGIQAAAIAERRGISVSWLPAPFIGVPVGLSMPEAVDRALVYAIVRQESAFNHQATSHAGARGLMQLMPGTARETAAKVQLPFSVQRLTSDPLYNATLGAHHLGELLDRLDRSYVLTFVGYNAGPGRARQWVAAYGDPRGGAVDPVDWIERIPFDETRNYVQKVMENLQIYRSRIGYPLSLSQDLTRGGPQG